MIKIQEWLDSLDFDEKEFFPPSLEVLETPPSPIGRMVARCILGLVFVAILWACIGEIDEVAVADGKVVPAGYTKTLQAEDKGIVHRIMVQNGQHVREGDILLELDRTLSESDLNSVRKRIAQHELAIIRLRAEQTDKLPIFDKKKYDPAEIRQQESLYRHRTAEKNAKLAVHDSLLVQKQQELSASNTSLSKNAALLEIARERAKGAKKLWEENGISRFNYMDYQGRAIELERAVETAKAQVVAAKSDIASETFKKQEFLAEWNRQIQEELLGNTKEYELLKETERKAELKNKLIQVKAPVTGTVHQMEIHTLGAVVQEAQPLLCVVPDGTKLEVEAWISNEDAGFVKAGQPVEIKVGAFNFQKFGIVNGTLESISPDAVEDKQGNLRYKGIISIKDTNLNLLPGMKVSAEVKTRKKRIIDFFLEPFKTYKSEALRER